MRVGFKMQGTCVFVMEYIGYFSFGMHWITYFMAHHLTHSLGHDLNGEPLATAPSRDFMENNQQLRTIEKYRIMM